VHISQSGVTISRVIRNKQMRFHHVLLPCPACCSCCPRAWTTSAPALRACHSTCSTCRTFPSNTSLMYNMFSPIPQGQHRGGAVESVQDKRAGERIDWLTKNTTTKACWFKSRQGRRSQKGSEPFCLFCEMLDGIYWAWECSYAFLQLFPVRLGLDYGVHLAG
jgi:hypothetical protein